MRLNNHCERDEECRASQENSVCSKLLHICQCRSVFVKIEGLKNTVCYLSVNGDQVFMFRKGFLVLVDKMKAPVSCTKDPQRRSFSFFVDPVSIGILAVLGVMFIVICMVLQMFSRSLKMMIT